MKNTSSDTPNAIAYCRVANTNQTKPSQSLESQRKGIAKTAKDENLDVVAWFEFTGSATNTLDDTGLQAAHDYCKKNPSTKFLIVSDPSRISRSEEGKRFWQQSFAFHGVTIKFTKHK